MMFRGKGGRGQAPKRALPEETHMRTGHRPLAVVLPIRELRAHGQFVCQPQETLRKDGFGFHLLAERGMQNKHIRNTSFPGFRV